MKECMASTKARSPRCNHYGIESLIWYVMSCLCTRSHTTFLEWALHLRRHLAPRPGAEVTLPQIAHVRGTVVSAVHVHGITHHRRHMATPAGGRHRPPVSSCACAGRGVACPAQIDSLVAMRCVHECKLQPILAAAHCHNCCARLLHPQPGTPVGRDQRRPQPSCCFIPDQRTKHDSW
jgi:hypothetical protein